MDINQLISVLRRPEHHYEGDTLPNEPMLYGQDIVLELTPEQNKIYTAILKTISKETLAKMAAHLRLEPNCAISLVDKIEWMSQERPPKCALKNEPIGRLLRYYLDKKSRQVVYARTQLRSRFLYQSYQDQNKILMAFLNGSKDDRDWAARYLRDNWRKEMAEAVSVAWDKTSIQTLAYVILRHFPDEYILKDQKRLSEIAGYQYVCARVGNDPSFVLDESRLNTPDYFYVMAKLGGKVDAVVMEQRFYDYLLTYPYDYRLLNFKPVSILSIEGVDRMIWAMGVLGMQDALVRLLDFLDKIMCTVQNVHVKDGEDGWPILVANIKLDIDPSEDNSIFERERIRYIEETDPQNYVFEYPDDLPLF